MKKFTNKQLKDRLYEVLREQGIISNYKISQKTGIDEGQLSKIRRGIEPLPMNTFIKICNSFNLSFDLYSENSEAKKNKIILEYYSSNLYDLFAA